MDIGLAVEVMRSSVVQTLIIGAPILIVGMVVGLIIAIFQATTSIQEQTLTFVPKIAAILAVLLFLGPWLFGAMVQYASHIFDMIPTMVK